ncbi:MAG: PIN domain-containing protein [Candidatus Sericytochromatia bacterium]|nr:PIN domain-containing protein [Candidatus Tanganyikabacteria bacterium]
MILVDTSAIVSIIDATDPNHRRAVDFWSQVVDQDLDALTHSYVVSEATSLIQRRHGFSAARFLLDDFLSGVEVHFVDPDLQEAGVTAFLAAGSRSISLVDQVSFALMRQRDIRRAFAFDDDFLKAGFETVPD